MEKATKTELKLSPPYLSVAKMERLFFLLSSRSFSDLSADDLRKREFSTGEAFQGLQALRFLGFLDSEGKLKNTQALAMKGEARILALQEAVKKGYSKLFQRIENPAELKRDELYNEFIAEYDLSPRLTRSALPLFLWLSKEAGFSVSEEITPRNREKSETSPKREAGHFIKTPVKSSSKEDEHSDGFNTYNLSGIILKIPRNDVVDDAIAAGGLVKIRLEIMAFAKKVGLKTNLIEHEAGSDS